jgi:CPA1 family monovalent cation:H+ antiporter
MDPLMITVLLVAVVVTVAAISQRYGLLHADRDGRGRARALVRAALPGPEIDPHLVIVGVLPPLLFVAAIETSVPAFRYNLRPILLLAVGHVLFIAAVIGFVVHALLPQVPLAACFALGAVVAPPDAIAATAVARRIGLNRRMVTILEGESLLNDATALVLFRVATAAAIGAAVGPVDVSVEVVRRSAAGPGSARAARVVFKLIHSRTTDPLLDNAWSLLCPFVVAAGPRRSRLRRGRGRGHRLYLGHRMPDADVGRLPAADDAFWQMLKFLLEGLVFLVVGLQLREILADLDTPPARSRRSPRPCCWWSWWVGSCGSSRRRTCRAGSRGCAGAIPARRGRPPAVISWAGMRGVVTLATALALPFTLKGRRFVPEAALRVAGLRGDRDYACAAGHDPAGGRRLLHPPTDDPVRDNLAEAQIQNQASRAARARLDEQADGAPDEVVERLRRLTEDRSNAVWERLGGAAETPSEAYIRLRRQMLEAEREVFRVARDEGRIPEEVLVRAQRQMDLEESYLERSEG